MLRRAPGGVKHYWVKGVPGGIIMPPVMLPFRIDLGPVELGPMEAGTLLGVVLTTVMARRRMGLIGIPRAALLDLALGALLGGAAGARLFCAVPGWIRGLGAQGGSGIYGGLLGGALGLALAARFKRLDALGILDAAASVAPAGFVLGKIGCFLAGCCYGRPCGVPPGVRFPPGSLAFETHRSAGLIPQGGSASLPVHPTQLYEAAFGLALLAGLWLLRGILRRRGSTLLAFIILYSAWRFGIEFLRDDPGRHTFGSTILTDAQIAALAAGAAAAAAWTAARLATPRTPPTSHPPPICGP